MGLKVRRSHDDNGSLGVVAVIAIAALLAVAGLVIGLSASNGSSHKLQVGDDAPSLEPGSSMSACAPCDTGKRAGKKAAAKSTTTTSGPGNANGAKSASPRATSGGAGSAASGAAATTPPPSGFQCGTDPQFSTHAYQYDKIVNSNGYNTYVQNNMWAAQPGTVARLCSGSPGDWTVDTSTQHDDGGAVQTYPQVQQLFNDFCDGQWNTCSDGKSTPISRLTQLSSSYSVTTPSTSGTGAWEVAYDLWLSNTPQSEIMVWVVTSDERGTGGASVKTRNASIGGQSYNLQVFGGNLPQLVLTTNQSNATIDLLALLKFLQAQKLDGAPVVDAGAAIDQIDFGVEVCDTHGQSLHFATGAYSLSAAAN